MCKLKIISLNNAPCEPLRLVIVAIAFLLLTGAPTAEASGGIYRLATFGIETLDLSSARLIAPSGFNYPLALDELRTQLAGVNKQRLVSLHIQPGQFATADRGKGHNEAYYLKIQASGVDIIGSDKRGALYGILALTRLLQEGEGQVHVGEIYDWPTLEVRALHLDLQKAHPVDLRRLIHSAAMAGMNTLIVTPPNTVILSTLPRENRSGSLTRAEFLDLVAYARGWGFEIVPEFKLLSHQEYFLGKSRPDLMYNQATYDPRNKLVYQIVFATLDEWITLIRPKAIHIGHDEIAGHNAITRDKWLAPGEGVLPAELFLQDVLKLNRYLKARGIETWMWGDMLLDPIEFPQMLNKHLHGNRDYAALRAQIPKDIVIGDWHYFDNQTDFPSARAFADLGHPILGVTWKTPTTITNFSNYVARMPNNNRGMIATTWFHVQRKEWTIVDNIIRTSGEAFWNAQ